MLDPGMAEFQAAMQAKPRPRRGVISRKVDADNLSAPGALRLAQIIKAYWDAAGFTVQTEIVHSGGGSGAAPVWGVRSDMIGGRPRPQGGRNGASKWKLAGALSPDLSNSC
jgi:hypothetical protein